MSICSAHQTPDTNCDLCKVTISPTEIELASEIKRLEAENAKMFDTLDDSIKYRTELELEAVELRARIALLEVALGLPEGCDVFELERAQKEGARTKTGEKWFSYRPGNSKASNMFAFINEWHTQWWFVTSEGIAIQDSENEDAKPFERLYCIKEGGK